MWTSRAGKQWSALCVALVLASCSAGDTGGDASDATTDAPRDAARVDVAADHHGDAVADHATAPDASDVTSPVDVTGDAADGSSEDALDATTVDVVDVQPADTGDDAAVPTDAADDVADAVPADGGPADEGVDASDAEDAPADADAGTPCSGPADCPGADTSCSHRVCTAGFCGVAFASMGTSCTDSGGTQCDGMGSCVECIMAATCAGTDTTCVQRTCVAGHCGHTYAISGTLLPSQHAGDCQDAVCDGTGSVTTREDDADLPVDGNACTNDVCTAGVPSNPPTSPGSACNQGGGSVCDGVGRCVGCVSPTSCPGSDTECGQRTCVAGACGMAFVAPGAVTLSQVGGDCETTVCNGAGGTTSVPDNTDVPVDGNQCTLDQCVAGVPSNPPASSGTACNQNGGTQCNGSGACVSCTAPSDCPGTDGPCGSRICTAGICGMSFTATGTRTPAQVIGNCQVTVCDGSGGTMNVADNTDVPSDDGNQCTAETCTAGAPSHPPTAGGTACNQSGGMFCDGIGDCLQCLTGSECASGVCTAGVCMGSLCTDGTRDGSETGTDCGGGTCPACPSGQSCLGASDCLSGSCIAGVCQDLLLISQIQTRGDNGGNDEFVEIYNPGSASVTFDSTWTVTARSAVGTCTSNAAAQRFAGTGQVIPSHHHLLFVNSSSSGYNAATASDATYTTGITDASSVMLNHATRVVDAVCFSYDTTTQTNLTTCATAYTCEGTPVTNPHNNTTSTNTDASLERRPGGAGGNGTDTNNNTADFMTDTVTAGPRDLASPAAP